MIDLIKLSEAWIREWADYWRTRALKTEAAAAQPSDEDITEAIEREFSTTGEWPDGDAAIVRAFLKHSHPLAATPPAGERSPPAEPQGWLSMDSAPKDGTCVLLRIEGGEHPMQDDDPSVSIGSYGTEGGPEEGPTWNFTGWSWHQDCYCRGTGTVTGWLPLPPTTPSSPQPKEL